jgi:DNA polymerase III subunit delta
MAEAIYLYHCTNEFLLNHTIEEKIKEFNVDPFNIIKYDLLENPSDDILEDLQTVSFFAETKVIVIRNIEELEKEDEYVINSWISYFEKPNPDVILIIAVSQLLPDTSALGAALFKYAFIEKVKDMEKKDYPEFIKNMFKKYQYTITDDAVDALLERTNLDFNLINQEAEKLMLFAYDTKEIHEKAVTLTCK